MVSEVRAAQRALLHLSEGYQHRLPHVTGRDDLRLRVLGKVGEAAVHAWRGGGGKDNGRVQRGVVVVEEGARAIVLPGVPDEWNRALLGLLQREGAGAGKHTKNKKEKKAES